MYRTVALHEGALNLVLLRQSDAVCCMIWGLFVSFFVSILCLGMKHVRLSSLCSAYSVELLWPML